MANPAFYSNENFPFPSVVALRGLGYDVLTTNDAGNSGKRIPDDEVLNYATAHGRCVLTLNRKDFIKLHDQIPEHEGIIVCEEDFDFVGLAQKIDRKVKAHGIVSRKLLRIVT